MRQVLLIRVSVATGYLSGQQKLIEIETRKEGKKKKLWNLQSSAAHATKS